MDAYNVKYGFLTTYDETWILRRADTYHFVVSPVIKGSDRSQQGKPSLREVFLFLAIKAANDREACVSYSFGANLVRRIAFELETIPMLTLIIISGQGSLPTTKGDRS
jgi:hypothetical protein